MSKPQKPARTPAPSFTPEELNDITILHTPIGSHLYGLAHAESDEDFYRVVPDEHYWQALGRYPSGDPKIKAQQRIIGNQDNLIVSMKTFSIFCHEGIPQALEAMFSQSATIDKIGDFRNQYCSAAFSADHMWGRYTRTIKTFAYGNAKMRRHSLRLAANLNEAMRNTGFFNPRLSDEQAKLFTEIANSTPEKFTSYLNSMNRYEIESDWNMEEIRENFAL